MVHGSTIPQKESRLAGKLEAIFADKSAKRAHLKKTDPWSGFYRSSDFGHLRDQDRAETREFQRRSVAFPSGISYIYKVNIRWPSSDAACLQRLELQTPYQKLKLIRDFTSSARVSSDGLNKLVYFDSPCEPLPVTRQDYNQTCLEKYEWAFDN
ncbi:Oidioi.mRNA.OKI2018_I69.chr1.g2639.t1.cds [Oikopleura dioica]|uniref:Oidioi.mRNA.OKI2018_I69.chr1.g2639.t1.cds n=1 Tax=Oikopleura dioica TaxID=34765 RepID=A0ABN7STG2_OIKDI|nr:Oidioi.mRNA.OKI2018_I69.chr1.g2639.t1.cds [Oikopleura dioica]